MAFTPSRAADQNICKVETYLGKMGQKRVVDLNCRQRKKRKLVLHFDLRNTILVADAVTQTKVEQAVNSYLSGVTWGTETSDVEHTQQNGGWSWVSNEPSLVAPRQGAITYYKHLEKQLVRAPDDRVRLRQLTGSFTQELIGQRFQSCYRGILEDLKWRHDGEDKKLTMAGYDGQLYHYILPSFFALLHHLHEEGRDFTVIIRTYGMDASNVLSSITHCLHGQNHPMFPRHIPMAVSTTPGAIRRTGKHISLITEDGHRHSLPGSSPQKTRGRVETNERDIYNVLSSSAGVSAFVDDFCFWEEHDYHHAAGKPLWIDPTDSQHHHIFFDDNLRLDDEDSIVDVRLWDAQEKAFRSQTLSECRSLQEACLVHADLLKSAGSLDYFVNNVTSCEESYDRYLSERTVNGVRK